MTLGLRALINRISAAAAATGITACRVDWRRNAKGELVVALIIDPAQPGFGKDAIDG